MLQIRVDQLRIGQRVDLECDVFADPDTYAADGDTSVSQHPEFQFEFQTVTHIEQETSECTLVVFENFACGFPPDHLIDVDAEQVFDDPL